MVSFRELAPFAAHLQRSSELGMTTLEIGEASRPRFGTGRTLPGGTAVVGYVV